jgi:hypothetical protein
MPKQFFEKQFLKIFQKLLKRFPAQQQQQQTVTTTRTTTTTATTTTTTSRYADSASLVVG